MTIERRPTTYCDAIREGRCDVALAGASSLTFPNLGYLYSEGLVASPDGKVRPFDRDAGGTLFGDGIGDCIPDMVDSSDEEVEIERGDIPSDAESSDGELDRGEILSVHRKLLKSHHEADVSPTASDAESAEDHKEHSNTSNSKHCMVCHKPAWPQSYNPRQQDCRDYCLHKPVSKYNDNHYY